MLFLFRFIFKTVLLGLVTKALGRFFPIVLRLFRMLWR